KVAALDEFLDGYGKALVVNDPEIWASYFTDSVDYQYQKNRKATRKDLALSNQELLRKYPSRKLELLGHPQVVELEGTSTRVGLDFSYRYLYEGDGIQAAGIAYVELALQWTSDGWK